MEEIIQIFVSTYLVFIISIISKYLGLIIYARDITINEYQRSVFIECTNSCIVKYTNTTMRWKCNKCTDNDLSKQERFHERSYPAAHSTGFDPGTNVHRSST